MRRQRLVFLIFAICAVAVSGWASAREANRVPVERLLAGLHWRSVGPYIGGRVVAVAGVPGKRNLFYMGAVDGGIWKSTDYGIRWTNISDGRLPGSSASIGALAVAPSNPGIIYAGTGESDIRGDMVTGDGVYKTTDGGKHWSYAGLRSTHTIMSLVVDPANPKVVYAASMGHVFKPGPHRGVFKTTDGGKTWHRVLFINDRTGVVDLVMDPANPKVLYAAAWQAYRTPWKLSSGGPGSGIYQTTDGGRHWRNLSRNPGLPRGVLGKIGLAVAASNPNILYAAIQARGGGVFRSTDGGRSWKRVNREWKLRQRAFYYMSIFVDPQDPDTVYMPQVGALFVSHDGGRTFRKLRTPHGDNHIVWINPEHPNILLEGNDGGATVSTDGGKTWSTEHNQPTGQFYSVNLDGRFPFHIYGAQQDEGSIEGPSATGAGLIPLSAWHGVAYGESTIVVPQPGDPKITYGSGYYSIFLKYNMADEQYQSVSPWPDYQDGATAAALKYRFAWTHPILFSPVNSKRLLIGSQYVMTSDDHGRTWRRISPDLTRNVARTEGPTGGPIDLDQSGAEIYPSISALAVSPLDGKVIWAGSSDGLVHVTTDGGRHWREVRPPMLPRWSRISSIEPSHVAKDTAYLTARRYMWDDFHPYVFKTTDAGRHWSEITNGLPDNQYIFDIKQDPNDARLLLLGAKNTVYVSLNGGALWRPLTLNLPLVQVRGVAINVRQGQVVIATHGRAFWVLDNLALLEQLTRGPRIAADRPALFTPETAWLSQVYGISERAKRVPAAGTNPPFGATVFFHIPTGYTGKTPVSLTFIGSHGRVIRRFDLHLRRPGHGKNKRAAYALTPAQKKAAAERKLTAIMPGMNHFQWNLRYADATAVKGFYTPAAAGGLAVSNRGPTVVPATYRVVLQYGGTREARPLVVRLDPRIQATAGDLAARLALQIKIHDTLSRLGGLLNQAIGLRDRLTTRNRFNRGRAVQAITTLDRAIGALVQLGVRSSEGDLLHEMKFYARLAYLQADIGLAYSRPTAAQYAVFRGLLHQVQQGERRLRRAIADTRRR